MSVFLSVDVMVFYRYVSIFSGGKHWYDNIFTAVYFALILNHLVQYLRKKDFICRKTKFQLPFLFREFVPFLIHFS